MPVANSRAVMLVDDGELDDVARILKSLAIEFDRFKGGSVPSDVTPPTDLLVATPRRIADVKIDLNDTDQDPPTRIVVVNEDSNALRAQLREIGFDYLVRRPVHAEALRLLVAHCIYRGDERRVEPRIPVGFEISFRMGVLSRRATLADLSTRGCRLLSPYPLEAGKRVCVTLTESLGATEELVVEGTVLRNHFDERLGFDGLYAAAVEFEDLSSEARNELEWILEDKVAGPPTLQSGMRSKEENAGASDQSRTGAPKRRGSATRVHRRRDFRETVAESCPPDPRSESASVEAVDPVNTADSVEHPPNTQPTIDVDVRIAAQPPEAVEEQSSPAERRSKDRRIYNAKVPAFGTRALKVLVGRDLSVGGMRIEYSPNLELGDRLHLAIYGSPGEEPFLVWGTVTRDDRQLGMGIEFDEVHPIVAENLEKMIASLPAVESLHDDEIAAMGSVLTEILDR